MSKKSGVVAMRRLDRHSSSQIANRRSRLGSAFKELSYNVGGTVQISEFLGKFVRLAKEAYGPYMYEASHEALSLDPLLALKAPSVFFIRNKKRQFELYNSRHPNGGQCRVLRKQSSTRKCHGGFWFS